MRATDQSRASLLQSIQARLAGCSDTPYLDALTLLGQISGRSKSSLLTHPSPDLDQDQEKRLADALERLLSGIPLPYVLGKWEFFQLSFNLTPDVLIPRPETEGLVERALTWLGDHPGRRTCLEAGTGSGCIAIALAVQIPDLEITATDISEKALRTARGNARAHRVENRVQFLLADLLVGIQAGADLLVANLPYIPSAKLASLKVSRTEPRLALDGGPDGLFLIKRILDDAPRLLNPGALLLLELDQDCGRSALAHARDRFSRADIRLDQDLSGQDRYLVVQT